MTSNHYYQHPIYTQQYPFKFWAVWNSGSRPAHYLLIHSKPRFLNVINIHICHRKLVRALVTHFLHNLYVPKMKECLPFFCIRIRVWILFCSYPQNPKTNMCQFSNPHFTPEGWRGFTKRSISGQHHGTALCCHGRSALSELFSVFLKRFTLSTFLTFLSLPSLARHNSRKRLLNFLLNI